MMFIRVAFISVILSSCVPVQHDVRQADGSPIEMIEVLGGYNSAEFRFFKPGARIPYRHILCSHINNTLGQPARCIEAR